jgi:hypothetical protein
MYFAPLLRQVHIDVPLRAIIIYLYIGYGLADGLILEFASIRNGASNCIENNHRFTVLAYAEQVLGY